MQHILPVHPRSGTHQKLSSVFRRLWIPHTKFSTSSRQTVHAICLTTPPGNHRPCWKQGFFSSPERSRFPHFVKQFRAGSLQSTACPVSDRYPDCERILPRRGWEHHAPAPARRTKQKQTFRSHGQEPFLSIPHTVPFFSCLILLLHVVCAHIFDKHCKSASDVGIFFPATSLVLPTEYPQWKGSSRFFLFAASLYVKRHAFCIMDEKDSVRAVRRNQACTSEYYM